jgi:ABC-type transport system substrate-binding protein
MHRHRSGTLRRALLSLLPFFLLQCGDRPTAEKAATIQLPRSGGIYRAPLLNSPTTLDPARAEDIYSHSVIQQLFDGLVQFTPDLLIVPALAESWEIEEGGLVYRFFLRDDAHFHNGQAVRAEDAAFALKRLIRADPPLSILPHMMKIAGARDYRERRSEELAGMEVRGERELRVRLEEPYFPFLAALGMHQAKVVPRDEVTRRGDQFGRTPVGSGPFQLESWEEGRAIRLKRFDRYHGGASYLEGVRYELYPGARADDALADFLQGKLEEMPLYGKTRQQLAARKDLQWMERPSLSLLFYGVNGTHPFLRHPKVRRSLSLAIDRQRLTASVYDGQFAPARNLLPPGMPGYNPESEAAVDDSAAARTLLEQALQEGLVVPSVLEVVSASQTPVAKAELEFIGTCWSALGITLVPKFVPNWSEFKEYVKSDAVELYRYAWFADIPDPDSVLQPLFGSDSNVNHLRYRDEQTDRLLAAARATAAPTERANIYRRLENHILQDFPLIPLVHLSVGHVYQPDVRGIHMTALGSHAMSLHRVWLAPPQAPQRQDG